MLVNRLQVTGSGLLCDDVSSAQTLARHSDLQTYTHVELHDQTAAIRALPGPGDGPISTLATTSPLGETGQVSTIVHSDARRRSRAQVTWRKSRE